MYDAIFLKNFRGAAPPHPCRSLLYSNCTISHLLNPHLILAYSSIAAFLFHICICKFHSYQFSNPTLADHTVDNPSLTNPILDDPKLANPTLENLTHTNPTLANPTLETSHTALYNPTLISVSNVESLISFYFS